MTSRAALSRPVRTVSSRSRPSPTLTWLVASVRDAEDFFLDDDRFADTRWRLCLRRRRCDDGCQKKRGKRNEQALGNLVTQLHFNTDRFYPSSVPDHA